MHVMAYMSLFTFWADVIPKKQAYEVNACFVTHILQKAFFKHTLENP